LSTPLTIQNQKTLFFDLFRSDAAPLLLAKFSQVT
jgi:hypothetical protein